MVKTVFEKLRKEKRTSDGCIISQGELRKEFESIGYSLSQSKISELETGRRQASINELKAYHALFNCPYEYLTGESSSRYYDHQTLSEEIGLTGNSIEYLKQTFRRFNNYTSNSPERITPEGRKLRVVNLLLEEYNWLLDDIGKYLDSALCDADEVQLQYIPLKYPDLDLENDEESISQRFNINGFNCQIEEQDYDLFCEIYLQRINKNLRKKWHDIRENYIKKQ